MVYPPRQVAYRINENGEAVPLDFTGTAEKSNEGSGAHSLHANEWRFSRAE